MATGLRVVRLVAVSRPDGEVGRQKHAEDGARLVAASE